MPPLLQPVLDFLWKIRYLLVLYAFMWLLAILVGNLLSGLYDQLRRWRRDSAFRAKDLDAVDRMEQAQFQSFLASLFRRAGFAVLPTPPFISDGVDLVLTHPVTEERIAVQARRTADPIDACAVQEIGHSRARYQCTRAVLVTCGPFTPEAVAAASESGVVLVDREGLRSMMERVSPPTPRQAA